MTLIKAMADPRGPNKYLPQHSTLRADEWLVRLVKDIHKIIISGFDSLIDYHIFYLHFESKYLLMRSTRHIKKNEKVYYYHE